MHPHLIVAQPKRFCISKNTPTTYCFLILMATLLTFKLLLYDSSRYNRFTCYTTQHHTHFLFFLFFILSCPPVKLAKLWETFMHSSLYMMLTRKTYALYIWMFVFNFRCIILHIKTLSSSQRHTADQHHSKTSHGVEMPLALSRSEAEY